MIPSLPGYEEATQDVFASYLEAAAKFCENELAPINRAADETGRAVRQMGLAASAVSDNPQLFIYGSGRLPPGPGEPGFAPPLPHP